MVLYGSQGLTRQLVCCAWRCIRDRLLTRDRMLKIGMQVNDRCVLCLNMQESRDHTFFGCAYVVWKLCRLKLGSRRYCTLLREVEEIQKISGGIRSISFQRQALAAAIWHIWQERNRPAYLC